MIFYILTVLIIGLNGVLLCSFISLGGLPLHIVPWDYPNLSNRSTTTSPFTIVFKESGSCKASLCRRDVFSNHAIAFAASFMNAVILSSVLSAGNHAMFAGTRVLYGVFFS